MRPFVIAITACLAPVLAGAQTSRSVPACPPLDSLKPPGFDTVAKSTDGRRVTLRIRDARYSRYTTYVVDSQFVVLVGPSTPTPAKGAVLDGLSTDDVSSVIITKHTDYGVADEWRSWHSCPGLPVVLILTKSKRWRPRVPGGTAGATRAPDQDTPPRRSE